MSSLTNRFVLDPKTIAVSGIHPKYFVRGNASILTRFGRRLSDVRLGTSFSVIVGYFFIFTKPMALKAVDRSALSRYIMLLMYTDNAVRQGPALTKLQYI